MNPPPPGAAGDDVELVVRVMIVPAATLLPAVALFELPAPAAVVNERIELPTVHMLLDVDGETEANTQVVEAPVYEYTVRLGLHAEGATTVTSAFRVDC